jgi:steroid 5-alpha reductase family enzyme
VILLGSGREYSHEMIASPWFLLLVGAIGASLTMVGVWLVAIRIANASYVDVAWALGIAGTAVAYALLADGSTLHRVLVAGLGTIWGVRLGTYLLARLAGKEEDGRYQELRRRWAPHANRSFFVFFQAQAAFIVVFSLPFAFVAADQGELTWLAWIGAALALLSIAGEMTADTQLAVWKGEPANRGKTARNGLWGWSRHPNYFFEWLHWVAWAVIAFSSPYGWVAIAVPLFLLVLLFKVTGIPETEAQSLRSRGDDYRRYQEEVSVFVPLPPRSKRASA